MSDDLISNEMFEEEKVDKVRTSSAEIVVHGTKEKPYYEIEYFDLSDNEMHIGFSSYKLDVVFGYLEKYFEIVNRENEQEQSENPIADDLISRKAVLNILTEARVKDSILCSPAFPEMLAQRIKKVPTAFDKEKVIEELRNEIHLTVYDPMISGRYIKKERAIEIIEKGGIE